MKLSALETKNYLARFYEALKELDGNAIGKTGSVLSTAGERVSPYLYHPDRLDQLPVYVAPAWSEHVNTNSLVECCILGITGLTYISVQYGHFNETVAKIPFAMKFDIKKDVAHFLERLNSINEINYEEPLDGALHVRINQVSYSSSLDA